MKKYYFNFRVIVYSNGEHRFTSLIQPQEWNRLATILSMFPNVSELQWFKSEVLKASIKGQKEYTGLNTFECFVTGDICELGYEDDKDNFDTVPTKIVIDFIDDAIEFHGLYDSGGIPGIIPKSKESDWVIIPKEYVREEYWKILESKDSSL